MKTHLPCAKHPTCHCALPPWGNHPACHAPWGKRPACQSANHPACQSPWGKRPACHARAFTLVELLVVIGIIGLLAALLTPVVMQSLTKARNAAIKAEIDMLHMAIMNYKNEYGSFPPCFDNNPAAPLVGGTMTSSAQKHVAKIFPRCSALSGPSGQFAGAVPLTPANAIYSWLSGYTADPTSPLQPPNERKKLYDFDSARVSSLTYFPSGKQNSPYIYIKSGTSLTDGYGIIGTGTATYSIGLNTYRPEPQVTVMGAQFFNPDTFQILSAGRDEIFGNDDDLSNFWPGTRREYLDSLKD